MAEWTNRNSRLSTSSSASCGKNSPTLRAARIISKRCGAAATSCANRAKTKQRSPPNRNVIVRSASAPAVDGDQARPRLISGGVARFRPLRVWRVETAQLRADLEAVSQSDDGFGGAEH